MTLTKNDVIEEIRTKNGFSRRQSIKTVETLLEIIKKTLVSGEDVMVSGFGKFRVKEKEDDIEDDVDAMSHVIYALRYAKVFYIILSGICERGYPVQG